MGAGWPQIWDTPHNQILVSGVLNQWETSPRARGLELMWITWSFAFWSAQYQIHDVFHDGLHVVDIHHIRLPWCGLKTGLGRDKAKVWKLFFGYIFLLKKWQLTATSIPSSESKREIPWGLTYLIGFSIGVLCFWDSPRDKRPRNERIRNIQTSSKSELITLKKIYKFNRIQWNEFQVTDFGYKPASKKHSCKLFPPDLGFCSSGSNHGDKKVWFSFYDLVRKPEVTSLNGCRR